MPSQTADYHSHLSYTNMSNSSESSSGSRNGTFPSMATTTSPPPVDVPSYSKMMLDHQKRQMERSTPESRRGSGDRHSHHNGTADATTETTMSNIVYNHNNEHTTEITPLAQTIPAISAVQVRLPAYDGCGRNCVIVTAVPLSP
ncbi:hypothetical protein PpBr36_01610 [Pyricularia pennisetigena]|uniref:hypothetical protein n=1 Tax=Pyricularia pennisetigena TaxID=1578925 RepID=UPI00114E2D37|nr:hypothetical protein PpBr36_01610 [Pyricularia pennisetigena]TLS28963.1 hypothetical protein PpBr36_01610 [Pyricularia pennisetigena]